MPCYRVKFETINVAGTDYLIRTLLDRQQYADPHGEAERAGISPAAWPLFGEIWPSARVLAQAMDTFDPAGKRILEIGAGLALAGLVVHKRLGDMTASDCHPLSRAFLEENVLLNELGPLRYEDGNWNRSNAELGRFDLIIGSDVLYERNQPALLAAFIDCHSAPTAEVLIVDPDCGNRAGFRRGDGRSRLSPPREPGRLHARWRPALQGALPAFSSRCPRARRLTPGHAYNRPRKVGQAIAACASTGRKVRAPQGGMPANGWASQGDGKCNREQTADGVARRTGKGETAR